MSAPDRWLVLSATTPSPELQPLLGEGLLALGGASIIEEGGYATTYLPPPTDVGALLAQARALLASRLPDGQPLELSWRWQPNEDWSARWKQGLAPRRITERLVVKPTWTEWPDPASEVVIDIDPQMAFGTGEHATTRACLRLLDAALRPGDRVLDVGSGSAILAIAAARLGAAGVVAVEYDPDANLNARENLARNGVEAQVRIVEALADAQLLASLGTFDLVLANILSSVIRPLLPAFHHTLGRSRDGRLIVAGILRDQADAVLHDAESADFRLVSVDEEDEWWSALLVPNG